MMIKHLYMKGLHGSVKLGAVPTTHTEEETAVRLICYKAENRWALAYRQIMNIR